MLKQSIIKQRAREISELANQIAGREHDMCAAAANKYLASMEKLMPAAKRQKFGRLMDKYLGAIDKANMELERVTYTQGLIDGFELARVLNTGSRR